MAFKAKNEIREALSGQLRTEAHGFAWDAVLENARLEARKDLLGAFLAYGFTAADALTHAEAWDLLAQEHQTRTEYWLVVKGLIHKTENRHGLLQDYERAWERALANVALYVATLEDVPALAGSGGVADLRRAAPVPVSAYRRTDLDEIYPDFPQED